MALATVHQSLVKNWILVKNELQLTDRSQGWSEIVCTATGCLAGSSQAGEMYMHAIGPQTKDETKRFFLFDGTLHDENALHKSFGLALKRLVLCTLGPGASAHSLQPIPVLIHVPKQADFSIAYS